MKKLKAGLAIGGWGAGLGFAGNAAAQSSLGSWYLGGTLGQSKFKDGGDDHKDTAWRILGGYQINRYFSAELGYHNLGEVSGSAGKTKGNAGGLVGVGAWPLIEQLSAYGKLGVYRGELKGPSDKETNNDLTYGAGLEYALDKQVGVRCEWQRYNKMGGGPLAETSMC